MAEQVGLTLVGSWRLVSLGVTYTDTKERIDVMAHDVSDLEIAILCDLLEGYVAILKSHKKGVREQLTAKRLVESTKSDPAKLQLSGEARHLLAERGVGISGGYGLYARRPMQTILIDRPSNAPMICDLRRRKSYLLDEIEHPAGLH